MLHFGGPVMQWMTQDSGRRALLWLAGFITAGLLSAAPAAATNPPGVPVLPAAGPLAKVGCTDGQVDFNRASQSAISAVFNAVYGDALPNVAKRVVEGRKPWYLDIEDLLTVDGIGPGRLPALTSSGRICLGFDTTKPPPADLAGVCRPGDGRIDVNRPSSEPALAKLFNKTSARAIVSGIPHAGPQPVIAEHIPGAGKGNPDLQKLCATPPTVTYGNQAITWSFVVAETGVAATAADGRSTLSVPPGAVGGDRWVRTEDLVATGAIKGTPVWDGDLMDVDPKQWATPTWRHDLETLGGEKVQPLQPLYLRLAGDADLKDDMDVAPVIVHFQGDPGAFFATPNAGIPGSAGDAGAWLDHLSDTWLNYQRVTPAAPIDLRMTRGTSAQLAAAASEKLYATDQPQARYANDDACNDLVGGPTYRDENLGVIGLLGFTGAPLIKWSWCTFFDVHYATWRLHNRRLLPVKVTMTGNSKLRGVNDDDNVLNQVLVENAGEGTQEAWRAWHNGPLTLSPNSIGDAQLRRHSDGETITLSTEFGTSLKYTASNAILEGIGLDKRQSSYLVRRLLECGYAGNPITCILSQDIELIIEQMIEQKIIKAGLKTGTKEAAKLVAKRIMLALTAVQVIAPLSDAGSGSMRVNWLLPPRPEWSNGRRIPEACAPSYSYTSWSWEIDEACIDAYYRPADGQPSDGTINGYTGAKILRKNSGAAYILDTSGVAHHIADGNTYICASKYIPVQYGVDDGEFAAQTTGGIGTDAICPPASGIPRNLAPGNPQNNVMLRSGDGSRTYIVVNGYLVALLNGASDFACFSERMLVWDWVSNDEFGRFRRHPSIVAQSCSLDGSLQGVPLQG